MDIKIALSEMFPGCTALGAFAEMDTYAGPQNCDILVQGLQLQMAQEGRKREHFLVDYKGTMMYLDVVDKWLIQGISKVSVRLVRAEGPKLSRDALDAWGRREIAYYS